VGVQNSITALTYQLDDLVDPRHVQPMSHLDLKKIGNGLTYCWEFVRLQAGKVGLVAEPPKVKAQQVLDSFSPRKMFAVDQVQNLGIGDLGVNRMVLAFSYGLDHVLAGFVDRKDED
jgi:hypothetical protein